MRENHAGLLREASQFSMSQGDVYSTLRNLTRRLEEERIPYALIGAMALAAHGLVRMTQGVDILTTIEGLALFRGRLVGRGYVPAFPGASKTFMDTETQVRIEILTIGEFPGDGKPKAVMLPDPTAASVKHEGMRVVTLGKLIELKLASGMSAPHRLRDLADVQDMIGTLRLPLDFVKHLHPSVRAKYRSFVRASSPKNGR